MSTMLNDFYFHNMDYIGTFYGYGQMHNVTLHDLMK